MSPPARPPGARPLAALHRLALRTFPRLPRGLRRAVVRAATPQHSVGAVCVLQHGDDVLFLRQLHRRGLTLPGGLLNRGEDAAAAVQREVREETGLDVVVGLPLAAVVAPEPRRVDVVYRVALDERGERPPVRPAGEALEAVWRPLAEVGVVDSSTGDVLAVVARARQPGAYDGRLR